MKKLIFVNQYEKCMDFSGFKNFLNLNLKFLKQNYKIKEEENIFIFVQIILNLDYNYDGNQNFDQINLKLSLFNFIFKIY